MYNEPLYEQNGVAMTSRAFDEYCRMFLLENELPASGRILDVAGGASSFTAELCKRGYDAFACDPLYKLTPDALLEHGLKELELAAAKLAAKLEAFVWKDYSSLEEHDAIRHDALQQFIMHYRHEKQQQTLSHKPLRYVTAELPTLPFRDHSFELVCCNHFLFLYQEQFDYSFHLQALQEMLRVTKQGGRIVAYPLVGFRNERYPHLDELIHDLQKQQISVRLRSTPFRFLPAAEHFLEITKQ